LSHPYADELSFALTISEEVDKLAMSYFNKGIEVVEKSDGSPVTRADKEVERLSVTLWQRNFPVMQSLGEEEGDGAAESNGRTWIVDPIDGTYNYARGIPIWSTLLALEVSSEDCLGHDCAPAMHEFSMQSKARVLSKTICQSKFQKSIASKAMFNFGGPNRILQGLWPELTEVCA
jgi:histidinol-phosphatase